jgi:hypothetical protein
MPKLEAFVALSCSAPVRFQLEDRPYVRSTRFWQHSTLSIRSFDRIGPWVHGLPVKFKAHIEQETSPINALEATFEWAT